MKHRLALLGALVAILGSTLIAPAATAAPTAIPTAAVKAVPDPTHPGTWSTMTCPGFNPIHAGMLPSGNILAVAGSGYNSQTFADNTANPDLKLFKAWIYEPNSGECPREIPLPQDKDLFCSGMASLPDGRMLFFGGTRKYGVPGSQIGQPAYYNGIRDTYVFDEATESFTQVADMGVGRWYGTGAVNRAGDPLVFGGLDENGAWTNKVQKFSTGPQTWGNLPDAALPMYAGMVMRPDGNMAYTGTYFGTANGATPKTWNPGTGATTPISGLLTPTCRDQGVTLKNGSQVAVIGGGCGASATGNVSMLNLTQSTLAFTNGPYLGYAAQHMCGVVLPDRSYFVAGGSVQNITARLEARRLGLGATSWQTLAAPTVPRQYHSTCLPLKDGRVVTMGTNYANGDREYRISTYTPWYAQGQGLVRPNFLTVSASQAPLGATITATNDYATINYVTLTKIPTSTHSSDPNQLVWPIANTTSTTYGHVTFKLPTDGSYTPPGWYMLSLLDWRGVPTVSKMLRILPAGKAIVKATASVTVGAGGDPCCCCPS